MNVGTRCVGGAPVCLGLLLFVGGCAGAAAPGTQDARVITIETDGGGVWEIQRGADIRVNQRVTVTRDEAWAVLPRVFDELEIEVDVQDLAARRMGAARHRFGARILNRSAADFFECGLDPGLNRPLAGQMPITAQVVTEVTAVGAGAELRTTVAGTARRSGGNAGVATCRSTGLLEVLIGEMVQKLAVPTS